MGTRRALIATTPDGETVIIGPVGSQAAIGALRSMLARHGWSTGDAPRYQSRAEWVREQVAPAYAEAAEHRHDVHGGGACYCAEVPG